MSVEVRVPAILRPLTGGRSIVTASGASIDTVISDLDAMHPGMAERLLDASGLRRHINIYLNGADIRFADGLRTPVADGSSITILPIGG